MDRKTAAQKLLEIADAIDKEAAESSYFVCASCNHTANLATINGRRAKAATEDGVQGIEAVTVNDVIGCPACQGDMRYVPTDMSERFYVEAAEGDDPLAVPSDAVEETSAPAPEEQEPPKPPKKKDDGEEDVSGEEIFKPVDEQKEEEARPDGVDEEEIDLDYEGDVDEEDEAVPGEEGEVAPAEAEEPEAPKKPKKKKKDKPDDGKPALPKDKVPKFEFPKKASVDIDELAAKYL